MCQNSHTMKRYLKESISKDLNKKIILLSGPRQCGKTTLSQMLSNNYDYVNFDNSEHRLILKEKSWDRKKELVIFDELHKLKKWKSWLKGVYDTEGLKPKILVTGSAKLDTHKKVGDSLAGRFFQYKLHPLDLKEIKEILKPSDIEKSMNLLLSIGGFPEPFLEGSIDFYNKWKRSHLDIILKQDLVDLENINQISSVETLIQLLKTHPGSLSSYSSLARDIQVSDKTIKRWLNALENMYVIFKLTPYNKNIARSLLKSPKYYFYDNGQVAGDNGAKLENLVACALLKEINRQRDCFGKEFNLFYLRDKDGHEIDFLILKDKKPHTAVEVKWSDDVPSANFKVFSGVLKNIPKIQIVKELSREKTYPNGIEIRKASKWLSEFNL
jgi:uncharacterized protein